ncbi:MAG: diguanylate cyclase domain-containing protein, partial [Terriglobia bacterium]
LNSPPILVEGYEIRLSASFGATISDGSEHNLEVFVRVADEALYQAKAAGRNCVRTLRLDDSTQRPG